MNNVAANMGEPAERARLAAGLDVVIIGAVIVLISYVIEPAAVDYFGRDRSFVGTTLITRSISAGAAAALAWGLLRWRRASVASIGLRFDGGLAQCGIGLLGVPAAYVAVVAANTCLMFGQWLSGHDFRLEATVEYVGGYRAAPTVGLLTLLVIGAAYEELLFRGLLLSRLRDALGGRWAAILLTSGVFGCMHLPGGVGLAVGAFAMSIVFGFVFVVSDSLLSATVTHLAFNLCQLYMAPIVFHLLASLFVAR